MALSKLESACMIYFQGEFIDSEECHLESNHNPESQFMLKEAINSLSEEGKLLVKTIMGLPDEAFYKSGQVIKTELYSWMKRRYSWNTGKVDTHRLEIKNILGSFV